MTQLRSREKDLHAASRSPLRANPWLIAITVTLATFMEILDTSAANVALPHIAGGLSASVDESSWVLTSYLAANAIVLPMTGWLTTLFGRKNFYITCVALFTGSSFLCGIAPTLPTLIVFRCFQGASGGALQPISQAILMETFSAERQGTAMSIYGMAAVLAPTLGPTLGGWITDNASWRWIFFINLPIGLLSIMLTSLLVHDPPYLVRRKLGEQRIDFVGFGLLATGLASLQIFLDKGQEDDWFGSHFILTFFCLAILGLIGGAVWEWFFSQPIVNVRLLRDQNLLLGTALMFLLGFILYASTYVVPLFLQSRLGYTAFSAGMALAPGGLLAATLAMPLAGRLIGRVGSRALLILGFCVGGYGLYRLSGITLEVSFGMIVALWIVSRFGFGIVFVPLNIAAFATTEKADVGQASGLVNLARNVGAGVGISALSTLIARRSQLHQTNLAANLAIGEGGMRDHYAALCRHLSEAGSSIPDAAVRASAMLYRELDAQSQMLSFADAFWVLSIISVLSLPVLMLLKSVKTKAKGRPAR